MTYTVQDKIEDLKKGNYNNEENTLKGEIIKLKCDIENLRNLNTETHCRIRMLEEEFEASQTDESDVDDKLVEYKGEKSAKPNKTSK